MSAAGLLLWILAGTPAARAEVLRHAVIVGSNRAPAELSPLRYAEDDADRVADLLVELGGFEPGRVTVLHSPSAAALDAALAAHRELAATEPDDLFVFDYSGHADQQGLRLGEEREAFAELRAAIRDMPTEVRLGILDACRSGEITRLKGLKLAEPFLGATALTAEGEAWLTAASADESAQESERLRGSFFTHYLLSGQRGAADKGDGVVSLDEAYAYAYDRTVARTGATTGGTQHPAYDYRIQGNGDPPLTDVSRASARLRLPGDLAGVVTVLRVPDELPVAEVAKAAGDETVIALPPGSYRLQIRGGGRLQEASFGLGEGAEHLVRPGAFVASDPAVAMKGGDDRGASAGWRRVDEDDAPPWAWPRAEELQTTARAMLSQALSAGGGHPRRGPVDAPDGAADGVGEPPGGAAVADAAAHGEEIEEQARTVRLDLRHSPVIAGASSLAIPGAGQFYNGQWAKGAAFLGSWALTTGGAFGVHAASGDELGAWSGMLWTGPTPWLMTAQIVRGWAAAEAWQFLVGEPRRPVTGVTLSYSTLWALGADSPAKTATIDGVALAATGLAADWVVEPGFSLGVDRTGYLRRPDGTVVVDTACA